MPANEPRNSSLKSPVPTTFITGTARGAATLPPPVRERRLSGLYLEESLPRPAAGAAPFLYANFVTSLDGRIAVTGAAGALRLRTLYLDPAGDDGAGQLFASFEPA